VGHAFIVPEVRRPKIALVANCARACFPEEAGNCDTMASH
jgi:hypothetical protein